MKVAIVHDYIKEYGGAERVLEALHELYPNAPVFTTVYLPKFLGPHRERFKNWKIKTSWFQYVPFKGKLISPLRIIAPFLFKSFDFSKFDVVIVSATGAYSPNIINLPRRQAGHQSSIHISYVHTPPRYLYGYATAREWKKNKLMNIAGMLMNHVLRLIDYKSSQNVDYFIANSQNVRQRIKKFYRRDAKVIYPSVDVQKDTKILSNKDIKKDYYLAGGRIARPKNIELIVKTFEQMKLPLKVFGREFGDLNIQISKYPNIQMLGEISDEKKFDLMKNAKAYIFASEDEDFGITPVEAQALGTPVIAYRSGGVLESIIEGKTGIFFDELSISSLKNAILRAHSIHFDRRYIINYAQKFSKDRFKREIKKFIESLQTQKH